MKNNLPTYNIIRTISLQNITAYFVFIILAYNSYKIHIRFRHVWLPKILMIPKL